MPQLLSPVCNGQLIDINGDPMVGGQIETYLAGSTTPAQTYTDDSGTVTQPNPIILNSLGYAPNPIWLTSGVSYKFVVKDAAGVVQRTLDDIDGVNDTSGSQSEWVESGLVPTYIGVTSFSVPGDQTTLLQINRRLRTTNTSGLVYSTIANSVFAAGITTVTLVNDSTNLDAGLSSVAYGLLSAVPRSTPNAAVVSSGLTMSAGKLLGRSSSGSGAVEELDFLCFVGSKNRFINGSIQIDQRNAGAAQTITAGAALAYTVDRWYAYCTGANVTGQRVSGTAPNQFNYRFTGAASVTKIGFAQRIEAANSQDLAGQTATLSVGLANSLLTTVTWTAWYANSADTFGTLASPTRTQIATGTFTVSSTLTRYNTQISIPSAATTGIEIEFSVGAQTSGTWTIGLAQLEVGSVATPFEHRPYGMELELCRRYYRRTSNIASFCTSTTAIQASGTISPPMRSAPTIGQTGVLHAYNNAISQAQSANNLTGPSAGAEFFAINAGNFTGLTAGASIWLASPGNNSNYLTLESEL